ncbi:MAG: S8 family serine peptidase [Bacteroidales bacterium]|nr:S8 family serine peptidase [Bacteroidales bacterium]
MNKLSCILAGLCLLACTQAIPEETVTPVPGEETVDSVALVPGEMIVEFSEELCDAIEADLAAGAFLSTRSANTNAALAAIGATSVERLYPDAGEWEPRHRQAGLHRWYRVTFDPTFPQTRAARSIEEIPGVVYAEPSRQVKPTAVFNDPEYGKQWHYFNAGAFKGHKAGCDINVEPVWRNFTAGSSDVIVAVIDGGIDLAHEDIGAVVIPGGSNGSKNFVDDSFVIKAHGHGTHVGGTIGAINNNGIGVCGIAGGNDGKGGVRLMSCQVFRTNPEDPNKDLSARNFGEALIWAADHGAVIANNSWGNVYETEEAALHSDVGGMKVAIDYFTQYAGLDVNGNQVGPMKGGLVIFAAGNEGWKIGWPAAYDGCVAVGAVAPDFTRADYSNYGDWVDIAAPGGSVHYDNGNVLSTTPGNTYSAYQGTSMACPHVSGIAALIVSQFGGPGFTSEMLRERLINGANSKSIARGAQIGPLADVLGSFSYGSTKPPRDVDSHMAEVRSNFIDYTWDAVSDPDDVVAYGYLLLATQDPSLFAGIDLKNLPSGVKSAVVYGESVKPGEKLEGTVSGLEFNTKYYTAVSAFDYSRNYSALSPLVQVTTGGNSDPVIELSNPGKVSLKAFETYATDVLISDPDGHTVTLQFTAGSDAANLQNTGDNKYRLSISGKEADPGTYTAVFTLTDEYKATTVLNLDYEIQPNHAPVPAGNMENLVFESLGQKMVLEMEDYISDPDGEQLTYIIETTPVGIVHLNQVEDVLNLTTLDYGLAHVIITGTDVKGEKASIDLKVLVRDPASAPDVYPTQVVDYLSISDGAEKNLSIIVSNAAGSVLYNQAVTCDAFEPAVIDMRLWAPGRYSVKVQSEGKEYKYNVVKI